MMQEALPKLKEFVKLLKLNATREALAIRLIMAFVVHRGRMSALQAAGTVRTEPRHRAQLTRFLSRNFWKGLECRCSRRHGIRCRVDPVGLR